MTTALRTRLARLEAAARPKSVVRVITGHSHDACDQAQAAMIERGEAGASDLFVHIRRFSEGRT
jgi:hypothetical protein